MKKRFKLLSIILCLVLAFTTVMTGCGDEENTATTETKLFEGIHGGKAEETQEYLLKNGATDYVIVVDRDPESRVIKAYQTLINFFNEATRITLAVKYDDEVTWSEDLKAISLGYNALTERNNLTNANESKTKNSYQIKTIGKTVFVVATDLGVVYGAQDLLNRWFNFEYFAENCYSLDKKTDVKLCNYDITEVPDIPHMTTNIYGSITSTTDSYYQTGIRLDGHTNSGWGHTVHNTMYYLPYKASLMKTGTGYVLDEDGIKSEEKVTYAPDSEKYGYPSGYGYVGVDADGNPDPEGHPAHREWYSDKVGAMYTGVPNQLCYSKQDEYKDIILDKLKYMVLNNDTSDQYMFGFEDNSNLCTCSECRAAKQIYGSSAGLYFKLISYLAKELNAWMVSEEATNAGVVVRPVYIVGLCYHDAYVAPAKYNESTGKYEVTSPDLVLDEHVLAYYCTRQADRFSSLNSNANSSYRDNMNAWADIAQHLSLWKYNQAWYGEQMQFNGYFSVIQQDYQFAAKNKVQFIMDEGQRNPSTFQILRAYLAANMAWDCNQDYEGLMTKFFDNYFGPASQTVRIAFDALCANLERQYYEGKISGTEYNLMTSSIYTKGFLKTIMAIFDQAIEDIAGLKETNRDLYNKYEKRITAESLCPRYLYLEIYYKSINDDELLAERLAFKEDANRTGIVSVGRRFSGKTQSPNDLWIGWGID